ncbi:mucin core protein, putative [Ixodes scapularis]|uniref:Mucin core protein, putative n=1 Tax=Ixodes scapularis TaxID=6945 RepID=B7P705_IXOSC|nr:mucin core protein, putative [Ixodes scapularis]|eukprot:XP_002409430.1 mucin core protein, putative [Ixodes scapularis]
MEPRVPKCSAREGGCRGRPPSVSLTLVTPPVGGPIEMELPRRPRMGCKDAHNDRATELFFRLPRAVFPHAFLTTAVAPAVLSSSQFPSGRERKLLRAKHEARRRRSAAVRARTLRVGCRPSGRAYDRSDLARRGGAPTTPASVPTAAPSGQLPERHFDALSFVGGIILSLGCLAILYVGFKFYKARTERNYHTL